MTGKMEQYLIAQEEKKVEFDSWEEELVHNIFHEIDMRGYKRTKEAKLNMSFEDLKQFLAK